MAYYHDRLKEMQHAYSLRYGKREQLLNDIAKLDEKVTNDRALIQEKEFIRGLYQSGSEEARRIYIKQLEDIVTKCLQKIFGVDYSFVIELSENRGKPEVKFFVDSIQDNVLMHDEPEESRGGGIVDVVSLALRMAVLQLYKDPRLNGPLILDEPGKHVSENKAIELANFIRDYVDSFQRQIIMVTHQPFFSAVADKTMEIIMVKGKSVIKEQEVNGLRSNET